MTTNMAPQNCSKCPALCAIRKQVVNGTGNTSADIMVVGQNPGFYEDRDGLPFVGKSGQLINLELQGAGIQRNNVYVTNAVRCLTPGNRKPKKEEVENCRDYLIDEIRLVNPKVIVTVGDTALQALYGLADISAFNTDYLEWETACEALTDNYKADLDLWESFTRLQRKGLKKPTRPKLPKRPSKPKSQKVLLRDVVGHTLIQPDTGIPMIPTYHPAYLMRGKWELSELVIEHFKKAARISMGVQGVGEVGDYITITNINMLRDLKDYLLAADVIAFDTETTGLKWMEDEILCISFSTQRGEGFVVPLMHNPGNGIPEKFPAWDAVWQEVVDILEEIFGSDKPKMGQNMLFDLRMLERDNRDGWIGVGVFTAFGLKVNGDLIDTELIHHSIAEALPHNMTSNLALYTDMPYYEDEIKPFKKDMGKAPNDLIWPYSAADADGLWRIWEAIMPIAEKEGVDWALFGITLPMIRVCRSIEDAGFPVAFDYFDRLCKFYQYEINRAEVELWQHTPFMPMGWKYNDPHALRDVLFKHLNLPKSGRKTDGGKGCEDCKDGVCFEHDQTGKDALLDIYKISPHPVIDCIIRLKNLTKRKSTYLDGGRGGFLRYIRDDLRIHPSMKISRAETGRLASEEPNSQNIPNYVHIHQYGDTCKDTGCHGKVCLQQHEHCPSFYPQTYGINTCNAFHDMVVAGPGKVIMNIDWSQLEVWVLAYYIWENLGNRTLLDVLESGRDIHLWMARQMYKTVDPDLDDKAWKNTHSDLRRRAKTLNFGTGYGLTAQGFVNREGCTLEEAEEAIALYRGIVPIDDYFRVIRSQLRYKHTEDWANRRRHMNHLAILKAMNEHGDFEGAMREGYNFPIQAGGSDLHSLASANILLDPSLAGVLTKRGCRVIMSIHDSLTLEVDAPDDDYAKRTAWILKDAFEKIAALTIRPNGQPLNWKVPVEVEWGQIWGSPTFKLNAAGTVETL